MVYNISHIFTIWFGSDLIIIALILYTICICSVDLKYDVCKRLTSNRCSAIRCVDIIFGHILILVVIVFILDIKYNFIHIGIVDYVDVRSSVLRTRLILIGHIIYAIMGLIFSIVLTTKAKACKKRWFTYGLFFNFLAALYFAKINRP
jgi:hypothetical protein